MSTKIYSDRAGHEVVSCQGPTGPELELWANPWRLRPEEARKIALAIFQWAVEHDAPPDPDKKPGT